MTSFLTKGHLASRRVRTPRVSFTHGESRSRCVRNFDWSVVDSTGTELTCAWSGMTRSTGVGAHLLSVRRLPTGVA